VTSSSLVFAFVALVTVVAALRVALATDAKGASAGLAGVGLGAAAVMVLLAAPTAAVAAGAFGIGASVVLVWGAASDGKRTLARRSARGYFVAAIVVVAALAWIFAGTMARQYVSFGVDLARRPEFGHVRAVGELAVVRFAPAFFGLALLAAVAVYALVAHLDLRRHEPGADGTPNRQRREGAR